jgi:hypothetical protein
MSNFKNKPSRVFIISLLLVLAAVTVHAETGKRSFFVGNPILFDNNYLSGSNNLPAAAQSRPMNGQPQVSSGKIALEVLAGVAGNVGFGVGSMFLIGNIIHDDSESLIPAGAVVGFYTGSLCGSALGVYLVGNSGNVRGKFGNAMLGSLLGEIISLGMGLLTKNFGISLMAMVILPPTLSVFMYNRSLKYRSLPEGNGLLNLNKDKLMLGIPDMQIRPIAAYGKNMKTEFQFKINVMSVVL